MARTIDPYNLDWAILKRQCVQNKPYLLWGTKSTNQVAMLGRMEQSKITSGKKHFDAIGVNYGKSEPEGWNL